MTALLLSCEHGGRRVPARYTALFRGRERLLGSHRGWDPGAAELARELARRFRAPLHAATVTRLLVDANRSLGHPALFSALVRGLPPAERARVLARHWRPHRRAVERDALRLLRAGRTVLHLSVHSFTPVLAGRRRAVDVGLLYDPRRRRERACAVRLVGALQAALPGLSVRRNAPYRGASDGLTTDLRRRLPARSYLGLELEVSQRFPRGDPRRWRALRRSIGDALEAVLRGSTADGP